VIRKTLLTAALAAALLIPVGSAHATTCAASDPTVDEVLCETVYPPVAQTLCKVKIGCY
jgi:hypothetical protein